jgi:hypothetical protein
MAKKITHAGSGNRLCLRLLSANWTLVLWFGMNLAGSVDEREPLDTQPDSYAVPFLGSSIFILDRS